MMTIKDLEYLKGFTMLPVKDPLIEAWSLLKNAEDIEKRLHSESVDPLRELGHQTTEQECAECLGLGYIPFGREGVQTTMTCPKCKGTGYDTTHTQPTTIDEGLSDEFKPGESNPTSDPTTMAYYLEQAGFPNKEG